MREEERDVREEETKETDECDVEKFGELKYHRGNGRYSRN